MVESTVTVIMWTEAHPSYVESQIETDRSPMVKRLQLKQKREKERWPRIRDGREGEKLNVSVHLKPFRKRVSPLSRVFLSLLASMGYDQVIWCIVSLCLSHSFPVCAY